MSIRLALPVAALFVTTLFAGCGSDDAKPTDEHGDHDHDADAGGTGGRPTVTNFDCKAEKWSNVSDACWSCMCNACETTLNDCQTDCFAGIECAFEKHTLVNVGSDIPCEIQATGAECLQGVPLDIVGKLITFDTCLITAPKDSGFRKCDAECNIPYSGDVCDRYPPAPAMN